MRRIYPRLAELRSTNRKYTCWVGRGGYIGAPCAPPPKLHTAYHNQLMLNVAENGPLLMALVPLNSTPDA